MTLDERTALQAKAAHAALAATLLRDAAMRPDTPDTELHSHLVVLYRDVLDACDIWEAALHTAMETP